MASRERGIEGVHELRRGEERLRLHPAGALVVGRSLAVADLHWGKGETLRRSGIAAPRGVLAADAARLFDLARAEGCDEIVVVGDLLHDPRGWTEGLRRDLAEVTRRAPVPVRVVLGNHDRGAAVALVDLGFDVVGRRLDRGGIAFLHEPEALPDRHVVAGHLHPVARLMSRHDRLRLRVFMSDEAVTVLPAFGAFTGGFEVDLDGPTELFALVEDRVLPL